LTCRAKTLFSHSTEPYSLQRTAWFFGLRVRCHEGGTAPVVYGKDAGEILPARASCKRLSRTAEIDSFKRLRFRIRIEA
jgi:hypothetical protein